MLTIEIPRLAPGLNGSKGLMRMHFSDYKKQKDNWIWWMKKTSPNLKAPMPCRMEFNRYYCKQPMDIDNAYAACKLPLDAMREAGIISDDNPNCVTSIVVLQHKVKAIRDEKTVIFIHESA